MTATGQPDGASERAAARRRAWLVASVGTAAVAVVFSAFVAWRMIAAHATLVASNPETAGRLATLRREIGENPDKAELFEQFRQDELRLRSEFLRAQHVMATGPALLAGGLMVALAGAVTALGLRNTPPHPDQAADGRSADTLNAAIGRWGTLGLVVATVASAMALVMLSEPVGALKDTASGPGSGPGGADGAVGLVPEVGPPHIPDPKDIARYWPRFRGPGGAGTSAYDNIPTQWDAPAGKGILWKTPVPLKGKSSPILWDKRLFVTAADRARRFVVCFDADSGKEMWRCEVLVPGPPAPVPDVPGDTGFAPCTPATDGRYVTAMFPNGDLACVDYDGKLVWARNLGLPDNGYGHGSSLATWRDATLVLFDQGGLEDGKSSLRAFVTRSGRRLWAAPRPVTASWATPIVIQAAGKEQIITSADPWVIAYAPADGSEIWRAKCMTGDVASSPVFAAGHVFAVHESADLVAIRPDGAGDVTKTHIAWRAAEGLPDITSPVSNGKYVWLLTTGGDLTCYDAASGKMLYLKELDKSFNSSPSIVGQQLWLMSMKGTTVILAAGGEFKVLHTNELGEPVSASPAFADGRVYIRGHKNLYCIGAK